MKVQLEAVLVVVSSSSSSSPGARARRPWRSRSCGALRVRTCVGPAGCTALTGNIWGSYRRVRGEKCVPDLPRSVRRTKLCSWMGTSSPWYLCGMVRARSVEQTSVPGRVFCKILANYKKRVQMDARTNGRGPRVRAMWSQYPTGVPTVPYHKPRTCVIAR